LSDRRKGGRNDRVGGVQPSLGFGQKEGGRKQGEKTGYTPMEQNLTPTLRHRIAGYGYTLATVAVSTAVLFLLRKMLSVQVIALLYLLPVMLSAARWGMVPSLIASVLAFFAYNFFFLAPTFTFLVSDPEELLGLMVFLIVAMLISQSVAAANFHAEKARAREQEATTLYTLTRALGAQTGLEETLGSVTRLVVEAFHLGGCEILTGSDPSSMKVRTSIMADPLAVGVSTSGERATAGLSAEKPYFPGGGGIDIPLTAHQSTVGLLRLHTSGFQKDIEPTTIQLLNTFASQLGLFIERGRLAREAGRAHLLEESDRLKSALLSSVSHDLRTPLSAIKAAVTVMLQEDVALDPPARFDLLSAINEETDRLNRLVRDLLDQSRIEAGALRLKLDWCDMDEIIRAVVRRHEKALSAFTVRLQWSPDLPLILADYVQIDRVATNLVENAIQFAPPGSQIEISAEAGSAGMTVAVTNQGPAIPARSHPHLFDKFYRISEDRSPNMGTGLGLSICKGIVEAHGGRIWMESPVKGGSGARFIFTLPFSQETDSKTGLRDEERDHEEWEDSHR
jgi:two-component system sensor histidine kinase KdpD